MQEREEAALAASVDALSEDEREWRMIVLELDLEQWWEAPAWGRNAADLDAITSELALLMGEIPGPFLLED